MFWKQLHCLSAYDTFLCWEIHICISIRTQVSRCSIITSVRKLFLSLQSLMNNGKVLFTSYAWVVFFKWWYNCKGLWKLQSIHSHIISSAVKQIRIRIARDFQKIYKKHQCWAFVQTLGGHVLCLRCSCGRKNEH